MNMRIQPPDTFLLMAYALLALISLITLASIDIQQSTPEEMELRWTKTQALWFAINAGIGVILIWLIPVHRWLFLDRLFYGFCVVLMLLTLMIGVEIRNTRAWLSVGPFTIQPVELAKVSVALMLGRLAHHSFPFGRREVILAGVFTGIPALLAVLQNDLGSAITFGAPLLAMAGYGLPVWLPLGGVILYILLVLGISPHQEIVLTILLVSAGLTGIPSLGFRKRYRKWRKPFQIISLLLLGAAGFTYLTGSVIFEKLLQPHQQKRLLVLTGQLSDPRGAGYHLFQVENAIASGGWTGKGYMQGLFTRLEFIPEQRTDFIFTTIAEEWGWLGSMVVLGIYAFLILRILSVGARHRDPYVFMMGRCISAFFLVHVIVNVGMQLRLLPVIGIPLPLVSYGGSQVLGFSLMLFLFIAVNRYRYEHVR